METSGQNGLVGQVVDGRYRVLSLLARGGMATVYEATDLRLDRTVALKVMHPHLAHDQNFVSRFQREAKSAARLTHGHVVAVYDQGDDGNGLVYLAMEYVPGRTLRDVMRQYGPLSSEQALVFLDPVLEALTAAHAAGFVHRDIKPENVLISNDGRVKVADFGLARALAGDDESRTQGMIIGTVAYLSPEQVERGQADGRSDVYAAGILLFEMITAKVPHGGDSPLSIAYQHVNSDVPPPSSVQASIPTDVDALVVTATRRDPALRYQSASDFLADVRRVRASLPSPRPFADSRDTLIVESSTAAALAAAGQGTTAHLNPPTGVVAPPPPPRPTTAPSADATPPERKYRRSKAPWVIVILTLAVLAAAFGGWYIVAGPGRTVPVPNVVGASVEKATTTLGTAGLSINVTEEQFSETAARGTVISTDPAAGGSVKTEGTVNAVVSKGPERYEVPALKGQTQQEAAAALAAAKLTVGAVSQKYDDKVKTGLVISSSPKSGASVKAASAVDIVISKGPKPVPVPAINGKDIGTAKAQLADAGLKSDVTSKFSDSVAKNVVISVKPKAGTIVASGTRVDIVTSKGPPPVTVPNLIDMPKNQAVAKLKAIGLVPKVVQAAATPLNRVYSQDPQPGSSVPRGSTVTIRII